MATEFMRLYRQLERAQLSVGSGASSSKAAPLASASSDGMSMYQKERKGALAALGHDVGAVATAKQRIKAPRHHGKAARRRFEERSDACAPPKVDKREEARSAQLMLEVTNQNKEVRDLLRCLSEADAAKASNSSSSSSTGEGAGMMESTSAKKTARKINKNFWNKYETLFPIGSEARLGRTTAPSSPPTGLGGLGGLGSGSVVLSDSGSASGSTSAVSLRKLLGRPEQRFFDPTRPRQETIMRKDFSANKWTAEERSRLNTLYWDIQRPVVSNKDAWNDYLKEFTVRFQAYFPARPQAEVRARVKHMIRHRAMKAPGEQEYWSKFRRSRDGEDVLGSSDEGEEKAERLRQSRAAAFRMRFEDCGD